MGRKAKAKAPRKCRSCTGWPLSRVMADRTAVIGDCEVCYTGHGFVVRTDEGRQPIRLRIAA